MSIRARCGTRAVPFLVALAVALAAVAPPARHVAAQMSSYRIVDLGLFGGIESFASGINELQQIVGTSQTRDDAPRAFVWQNGQATTLPGLAGSDSRAFDINGQGAIVGESPAADGTTRPTLWDPGTPVDLGSLGGTDGRATAINDLGQIVGVSRTSAGEQRLFLRQNGTMSDLGAISGDFGYVGSNNIQGQIVGGNYDPQTGIRHAFVWQNGVFTDLGTLPGDTVSYATDINNTGQIVGYSSGSTTSAFVLDNGSMRKLPDLAGRSSVAQAINDQGQIVGSSTAASGNERAVLWHNGAVIDLGTLPGGSRSQARDITFSGYIVGTARAADMTFRAVVWIPQTSDNRVVNPNFEIDHNGDNQPDGWSSAALATRSTVTYRSENSSLRLQSNANRDVGVWQALVGIRPGARYDVSAWVSIPPTNDAFTVTLSVGWKDASGRQLKTDTVKSWSTPTSSWNQGAKTLTAPSGAAQAIVRLNATNLAATVYIDDVGFQQR